MIRVELITEENPTPCTQSAPSIKAALDMLGGESSGARVVFPIDANAFFVDPPPAADAPFPGRKSRAGSTPRGPRPSRRKAAKAAR